MTLTLCSGISPCGGWEVRGPCGVLGIELWQAVQQDQSPLCCCSSPFRAGRSLRYLPASMSPGFTHLCFLFICFCFGTTPGGAQARYSGIIPDSARGTLWDAKDRNLGDCVQGKCPPHCALAPVTSLTLMIKLPPPFSRPTCVPHSEPCFLLSPPYSLGLCPPYSATHWCLCAPWLSVTTWDRVNCCMYSWAA